MVRGREANYAHPRPGAGLRVLKSDGRRATCEGRLGNGSGADSKQVVPAREQSTGARGLDRSQRQKMLGRRG
jgi:hypothetical protein